MKLFQGYKAASDSNFIDHINKKKDEYMNGINYIEFDVLIQLTLKNVIRKENGEWGAPSVEQEKLTALTAELLSSNTKLDLVREMSIRK